MASVARHTLLACCSMLAQSCSSTTSSVRVCVPPCPSRSSAVNSCQIAPSGLLTSLLFCACHPPTHPPWITFSSENLAERAWVVCSSLWVESPPRRWRSPIYLWCLMSEVLYLSVMILALCLGIREMNSGKCYIGLHIQSSLLLLSYDWCVLLS